MTGFSRIAHGFWVDQKIVDNMTPEDRYIFLYLLTNSRVNLCGCYELSLKQAAMETGYVRDVVENIFSRLESLNLINFDTETHEVMIVNWYKYNWGKSSKVLQGVKNSARFIKSPSLRKLVLDRAEDMVSIPYAYSIDTNDIDVMM